MITEKYYVEQKIYEAIVENGSVSAVRILSLKEGPQEADVKMFLDMVEKEKLLIMTDDGVVWIYGTCKSHWTETVSLVDEEIEPAKNELGGLLPLLLRLGHTPKLKYRLTLKHKNRDECFSLGIIDYKDSISKSEICDAVLKPIQKRRERSVNIKPPKLKKYIPTVVLYDGDIIRKEMRVTKVPRTFRHLGTKNYGTVRRDTYSLAEEKWMELRDEAERQARKLDEVLAQNAQMMREYENEVRAILNKPISGEEIESELKKYVLLIERSRSKIPSDVKK